MSFPELRFRQIERDEVTNTMNSLSHIDKNGNAIMVDISEKDITARVAVASGTITMSEDAIKAVTAGTAPKGDVLATARIAGIMAAKKTPELIPLCHQLQLSKVSIDFEVCPKERCIRSTCTVKLTGRTGAEMEALCGVSASLLTVYDMCKAIDKTMEISAIRLLEKDGGKSGHFVRKEENDES